jgi:demethylmenaquinone methyltransferase/2-methoxy-6-polyprenyl-1,4-benzoquinol methylase
MDESANRVRALFSSIAPKYDLINRILSLKQDKRWRRLLVENVLNGARSFAALDCCAGTADLTLELLGACEKDARVVALDFSRGMLEVARDKINRAGARGRALLVEGDALRLPFADNSFDVTMTAFGLRNLSDLERGLREMARVTRHGGTIGILEFSLPTFFAARHIARVFLRTFVPIVGWLFAKSNAYNHLAKTTQQFPDPAVLGAMMQKCGISGVRTWRRMFGIVTLYVGTVT